MLLNITTTRRTKVSAARRGGSTAAFCLAFFFFILNLFLISLRFLELGERRQSSPVFPAPAHAAPRRSAQRGRISSESDPGPRSRHTESSPSRFASELMKVRSSPFTPSSGLAESTSVFSLWFAFSFVVFYPGRHVPVPYYKDPYGASHLVRSGVLAKKPETEKGRGGRGSIARGRFRRQSTRLVGFQRPLYSAGQVFDTWIQSNHPKSGCKLGHCRASGGPKRCGPAFPAARRRPKAGGELRLHRGKHPE